MIFSFGRQALLGGLAIVLAHQTLGAPALQARDDSPCGLAPIDPGPPTVGDPKHSGDFYCDTAWDRGLVVTGIEVWATEWSVRGIQFTYSDDTKSAVRGVAKSDFKQYGDTNSHVIMKWGVNDTITEVRQWKNSVGDAVGRIILTTSSGLKFDAGCKEHERVDGQTIPIASGFLLGAGGVATPDFNLHSLTWLFLSSKVIKATMVNVQYDESLDAWNKQQKGVTAVDLQAGVFVNDSPKGSENQTFTFGGSRTLTAGKTWTSEHTVAGGASLTLTVERKIDIEVPMWKWVTVTGGVTTAAEGHFEITKMSGEETSISGTGSYPWSQGGTIAPGYAASCKATTHSGTFDSLYTATIEITLLNGKKYTIKQRGEYNGTDYAIAWAHCKDISLADGMALVAAGTPLLSNSPAPKST